MRDITQDEIAEILNRADNIADEERNGRYAEVVADTVNSTTKFIRKAIATLLSAADE